ncbi:SDR family oxidoreductase [Endothiovibrio diazotrophicus]
MRIVVFGGTGLVGAGFVETARQAGHELLSPSHREVDLADDGAAAAYIDAHRPDAVCNFVALPSIELCESRPELAMRLHVGAVTEIAKACEAQGSVFVQPSSHAVFDGKKEGRYTESDPPHPMNIYSATKVLSENLAREYCSEAVVPRFPTLFGRRLSGGAEGFVDKVVRWLGEGRTLRIARDRIDTPTYSLDVAESLLNSIAPGGSRGIVHLASEPVTSYYDFVVEIARILGTDNTIEPALDREFGSGVYKPLNTALASEVVGPLRSWKLSLLEYLA